MLRQIQKNKLEVNLGSRKQVDRYIMLLVGGTNSKNSKKKSKSSIYHIMIRGINRQDILKTIMIDKIE
ncbi:hypothetical protein SAMN05660297_03593 [Natronincola peptidivorans]|uniref:Uncharacterized protein n=2 Tax=Natronincola peptidivorans TaxID=426128 RepID=A0A1I0HCQ0_9FIRM|nr:hypothetical protein SAMN05660297_03593 [Natronincola peptidivorans]